MIRRNLSNLRRLAHAFVNRLTERELRRLQAFDVSGSRGTMGEIHWREIHARRAGPARWGPVRAPKFEVLRTSNPELRTSDRAFLASLARHVPRLVALAELLSILLEDGTALSLRAKPLPLHLLNEGSAVHMEQLSRFARNPVGSSKRADDETVLELLDLS